MINFLARTPSLALIAGGLGTVVVPSRAVSPNPKLSRPTQTADNAPPVALRPSLPEQRKHCSAIGGDTIMTLALEEPVIGRKFA